MKKGYMKVYIGGMFSGKTSTMLTDIDRANIAKQKTLVIKYMGDNRYTNGDSIKTHGGREYNGLVKSTTSLADLNKFIIDNQIEVVGIDEFQFMSNPEVAVDWVNSGIHVYISALDGDFKKNIFENVSYIIPKSDDVVKLKSVCTRCLCQDGAFTQRINNNTERVVIGGSESYIAVCRRCYSI